VDFLAATEKGAGRDVLAALASLLTEDIVSVTVAESNCRAMALYQRLGFVPVEEVDRWYRIMGGNGHE
jgi:ribosomal protein S18 acetylase RimI-like enzyme